MRPKLASTLRRLSLLSVLLLGAALPAHGESDEGITWLVTYKAGALPAAPQWTWHGDDRDIHSEIINGTLRMADESEDGMGYYRTTWEPKPDQEIVVEAKVRVGYLSSYKQGGKRKGGGRVSSPWTIGSPIGLLLSDGRHQDGLVLCEGLIADFLDRFSRVKTTDAFHVYRLVARGTDMQVYVDGQLKIGGKDAFCKPAVEPTPFLQFGSNSKGCTGEAYWDYVKVGVRAPKAPAEKRDLTITLSKPWKIPSGGRYQTRPYLYNVGRGVLLMSVAQGPDKEYEPYGILRSTDEGKTWSPVEGLQEKMFAPQPMIRLADGNILGVSRWNVKFEDYTHKRYFVGMTYLFDPSATSFKIFENRIVLPKEATDPGVFDRHIFDVGNGTILAVVYGASPYGYLVKTVDQGKTWTHFSTIARGDEPGVARISELEWTALLRQDSWAPLHQVWSHDGGKTWSEPTVLEEGSVDSDVTVMHDGVLAASYGRPGCNVMFSTDRGKSWSCHRSITLEGGFNYTTLCEVRPGRLLYVHDAPPLTALYIDVERVK